LIYLAGPWCIIALALTLLATHAANADGRTVMFVKGMAYGIAENCPDRQVDAEAVRKTNRMTGGRKSMKEFLEKILVSIPNYLLVFGAVFSGPKKFIAERRMNAIEEWVDALVFLAISSALTVLTGTLVQASGRDLWTALGRYALLVLFAVSLSAVTIRIAWWLVGGRASVVSIFIAYAYTCGVALVLFSVFDLLADGILKALDPNLYAKIIAKQASLSKATESTAWWVSIAIFGIGFAFVDIWGFIAWGAFRQLNGLTKTRSFFAFMISTILLLPVTAAVYFVAVGLGLGSTGPDLEVTWTIKESKSPIDGSPQVFA
jgi:hypothetical protein